MDATDGAQCPGLTRATDSELRDLKEASDADPFGPVLRQFKGKLREAIQWLLADRDGEAIGALSLRDVGATGLVYGRAPDPATGEEGYGLAKIAAKHPEVLDDLQGFLDRLQKDSARSGPNRTRLSDESGQAVIRLDFEGKPKRWLLTAYERRAGSGATTDTTATKALDDTAGQGTGARENIGTGSTDRKASDARHLQTSNEPDASVSSRIPDTTGQIKGSSDRLDFQADREVEDGLRSTSDAASTALPDAPRQSERSQISADFQDDQIAEAIAQARAAREADPEASIHITERDVTRQVALSDPLDDLDQDEALLRSMTSCSLKGTPK